MTLIDELFRAPLGLFDEDGYAISLADLSAGYSRSAGWNEVDHPRGPGGKFADTPGGTKIGDLNVPLKSGKMFHPESDRFYQTTAPTSALKPDERETVKKYAWDGSSFEVMNRKLRGSADVGVDEQTAQGVRDLTKVINKHALTKPTIVHRGVPDSPQNRKMLKVGRTFVDQGFMSTSTDRSVAELSADPIDEGKGIVMRIKLPGGTKAVAVNDMFDAEGGYNQHEVLIQRGTKFKVDSARQVGGTLQVELSLVQQIDPIAVSKLRSAGWNEMDHPRDPSGRFGNALTGKAAHNSIVRAHEIPGISDDEEMSLLRYQQYAHSGINAALRGGNADSEWIEHADRIRSAFDKAPPTREPIKVVRGVSFAESFMGPPGSRVGKEFTDHGVVSTTTSSKVLADRFGGETKLTITVPAGSKALRMSSDTVEGLDEQEVLLPPGTKFKVRSDRMTPNGRRIALDVVATPTDKLRLGPKKQPAKPRPTVPSAPTVPKSTGNAKLDALNKSLAAYQARLDNPDEPAMLKSAYKAKIKQIKQQIAAEKKGG